MKKISSGDIKRIYKWLEKQPKIEKTLSKLEKKLYKLGIKEDIISGFKKLAAEKGEIIIENIEHYTIRTGFYNAVKKEKSRKVKGPQYPYLAEWNDFFKKRKNKQRLKEGLHHKIAKELDIPLNELFYSALLERLDNYLTNPWARSSELERDLDSIELILNDLSEKHPLYERAQETINKSYDRIDQLKWRENFEKAFPV